MSPEKKSKERVLYICTFKIIMGINVKGGEKNAKLKNALEDLREAAI